MLRPTVARIKLSCLQHNVSFAKSIAPRTKLMAVIKADAYGHGALSVAEALKDNVEAFAVASLDEAMELRDQKISIPILILEGVFSPEDIKICSSNDITIAVHSRTQIDWLEQARIENKINCWLKIDTGMSRLGIEPEAVSISLERLQNCSHVAKDIVLFTHLACADDLNNNYTSIQLQRFNQITSNFLLPRSTANSAGILGWPSSHLDWIRPGYMLYGNSPFAANGEQYPALKPVMTLTSEIIAIRDVPKGSSVGYGSSWTAKEDCKIATVCVGYGDGYPRQAPSGTPVLINGSRAPLAGRVSMDMITVDISNISAKIGDEVILWGDGLPLNEIADTANTIGYELTARMPKRVPRIFIEN